jgi:hypothetical protein
VVVAVVAKGPAVPIAVKVAEFKAVVVVNSPFPLSSNVASVTDMIPAVRVFAVKELLKVVAPIGAVLPCSVTARRSVPGPPAWMTIVFESNVVWVNGGVPDPEAVTVHVPSAKPAAAADPLPVAIVVGVQPTPKQSPMLIRFADAPEGHRSGLASIVAAISKFLFIVLTPPNDLTCQGPCTPHARKNSILESVV